MSELIDPSSSASSSSSSSSSSSAGPEQDFSELLEGITAPPPKPPRSVRQGLPAEYRMRHDSHYVDELAARPKDAAPERAPAAAQPPVSIPAALRDLCEEFEGLASCFNLLEPTARPLRERLGLSLAKIGVQRSIRYAQQLRILLEDPRPFQRELRLDDAIRRAFDDVKEELRLTEATLALDLPSSPLVVRADPSLLQTALRACAGATVALIESGGRPAELQVSAFKADEAVHCEFRQDSCGMDRAPSRTVSVALNAARRIAELHGGTLETRPTTSGGTALLLSFV
jgi:hypothetical protein